MIIIILILVILMIIKEEDFKFDDISFRIVKNNYIMQVKYPNFNAQKKINKEIKEYVETEKKNFLKEISNSDIKDNEFNISYSYTIKNNIYSFHIRTYSITGKNNKYYRSDKIYYFDKENNKNLNLNNLIINEKIYEVFKDKIMNYENDNNLYIDEDKIRNNFDSNKDNYNLIMFGEDNLQLILEPHKINDYNREIIINVKYNDIINYLNKNYFKLIKSKNEEMSKIESSIIRDKTQFAGKKLVALTFDDGPSYDKTKKLIDELDKKNARVSFFMLGENAIKQGELVKEIYNRGHTIGSHTYDHKQLTKLKDNEILYEVNYTNEIIKNITGSDVKYLRPPYGSYNEEMLKLFNMSFILWNVDVEDWKLKNDKKIADYIINNVNDGDIVLLHDIHNETIDGVLMAIDKLQKDGYAFVSIDELINFKDIKLEFHKAYRYLK